MNKILVGFIVLASLSSFASSDCIDEAKTKAIDKVADTLNINADKLKARHIGGESLDGDLAGDGSYSAPSLEYLDVFFSDDDIRTAKAIHLFQVRLEILTDNETEELIECSVDDIDNISTDDWSKIYQTYL